MPEHLNADQRADLGREPDPITTSWTRQLDVKDKRIAELEAAFDLLMGVLPNEYGRSGWINEKKDQVASALKLRRGGVR